MGLENKKNYDFLIKDVKVPDLKNETFIVRDILILKGILQEISAKIPNDIRVIDAKKNLLISDTIDIHVHTRDPGLTHKETLETVLKASARGGFSKVVAMPNTLPVIDDKEKYLDVIRRASKIKGARLFQSCSLSKDLSGKTLNDFEQLISAGCSCFSDDGLALYDSKLMERAMRSLKGSGSSLLLHSQSEGIAPEHANSEIFGVYRDVLLSELTDCPVHIQHVSKKESIEIIVKAKERGVKITCEVCPHHLFLNESNSDLRSSDFKVNPPLRTKLDSKELIKYFSSGFIDVIASDHAPHTSQEKKTSYEEAPYGFSGVETLIPVIFSELYKKRDLNIFKIIRAISINPSKIINADIKGLKTGIRPDFTIVDLDKERMINKEALISKGKNNPFLPYKAECDVQMTVVEGEIVWQNL